MKGAIKWEPLLHGDGLDGWRDTLGEHIFTHFISAKREEWFDYIQQVTPWELDRYLTAY